MRLYTHLGQKVNPPPSSPTIVTSYFPRSDVYAFSFSLLFSLWFYFLRK